jgi:predicted DNA-binding transcriptional regulator AlpA
MKQVCEKTALSRSTIFRLISRNKFPKPAPNKDVPGRKAFDWGDVEAWIADQVGE